jgi:hypothetical protein
MKRVPLVPKYVETIDEELEDGIIYISLEYRCAIHLCACGCKNKTVTPLKDGEWTLTDNNGKITMTPSIGNHYFACRSHYIITDGVAIFQ